jgi:hypothetical protein
MCAWNVPAKFPTLMCARDEAQQHRQAQKAQARCGGTDTTTTLIIVASVPFDMNVREMQPWAGDM